MVGGLDAGKGFVVALEVEEGAAAVGALTLLGSMVDGCSLQVLDAKLLGSSETVLSMLCKIGMACQYHVVIDIHSFLFFKALLFMCGFRLNIHFLQTAGVHPEHIRCQDRLVSSIVVIW